MPNERIYPHDETYAEWHRPASIRRFMTVSEAESLWYIDADWIEACPICRKTLMLVEAVRDHGQEHKNSSILRELAKDAGKKAVVVFYKLGSERQPPPREDLFDIEAVRVKRIWPPPIHEWTWTAEEWAHVLLEERRKHVADHHS